MQQTLSLEGTKDILSNGCDRLGRNAAVWGVFRVCPVQSEVGSQLFCPAQSCQGFFLILQVLAGLQGHSSRSRSCLVLLGVDYHRSTYSWPSTRTSREWPCVVPRDFTVNDEAVLGLTSWLQASGVEGVVIVTCLVLGNAGRCCDIRCHGHNLGSVGSLRVCCLYVSRDRRCCVSGTIVFYSPVFRGASVSPAREGRSLSGVMASPGQVFFQCTADC